MQLQVCILKVIIEKSQTSQRNNVNLVPFIVSKSFFSVKNHEAVEEISQGFIKPMCMLCICGMLLIALSMINMFTVNTLILEA